MLLDLCKLFRAKLCLGNLIEDHQGVMTQKYLHSHSTHTLIEHSNGVIPVLLFM